MEVTRDICCKGCGETGQAVWAVTQWHPGVMPERTPVRVSGRFSICTHGKGKAIACGRCQQIHNHG
jgi:hypothetical protein